MHRFGVIHPCVVNRLCFDAFLCGAIDASFWCISPLWGKYIVFWCISSSSDWCNLFFVFHPSVVNTLCFVAYLPCAIDASFCCISPLWGKYIVFWCISSFCDRCIVFAVFHPCDVNSLCFDAFLTRVIDATFCYISPLCGKNILLCCISSLCDECMVLVYFTLVW